MPYFPIPEHRPTPASPFDVSPTHVNNAAHADDPLHDAWKLVLAAKQFLTDAYNYDVYGHKVPAQTPPHDEYRAQALSSSNVAQSIARGRQDDIRNLSDAEIFSLTQNLKDQQIAAHPLVAPTVPLTGLRSEYTSPTYLAQIDWLSSHGWTGLRRARGDGDCFYRSMAFAYVERILNAPDLPLAVATSLFTIEGRLADLRAAGFEPLVYEDFYDTLRDLVLNIVEPDVQGKMLTSATLLQRFQDPEVSNSIVVFLRLLTSAHIRLNADDFVPFLFDPETTEPVGVRQFCESQVEATGREADHPQVLALSRALKVSIEVAYMDGNAATSADGAVSAAVDFVRVDTEDARGNGTIPITLLYRPGHYDILERKNGEPEEY